MSRPHAGAATPAQTLRRYALKQIDHRWAGLCPESDQPDARDPDCLVCVAIDQDIAHPAEATPAINDPVELARAIQNNVSSFEFNDQAFVAMDDIVEFIASRTQWKPLDATYGWTAQRWLAWFVELADLLPHEAGVEHDPTSVKQAVHTLTETAATWTQRESESTP